jgi:hypothetical protein
MHLVPKMDKVRVQLLDRDWMVVGFCFFLCSVGSLKCWWYVSSLRSTMLIFYLYNPVNRNVHPLPSLT